jgi:hypothetical protein
MRLALLALRERGKASPAAGGALPVHSRAAGDGGAGDARATDPGAPAAADPGVLAAERGAPPAGGPPPPDDGSAAGPSGAPPARYEVCRIDENGGLFVIEAAASEAAALARVAAFEALGHKQVYFHRRAARRGG